MASPLFNRYPSSTRDMTVSQLVYHFGSSLNHGALQALEERDADWIREIDALRLHCCKQDADSLGFLSRINCLEQELSRQICLRRSLKEFASDSIQEDKEQLDRVRAEKADLEQELSRQICLRRSLKEFASDSIQENKEQLDRVRAEKADLEIALKADLDSKMALEAENRRLKALEKELNLRIEALEKEKEEIEAAQLCKAETEKSGGIVMMKRMEGELKALQDETIQLVSNIDVLKREKQDMEIEFRKAEKAKSAEIDMILNEKRTLQVLNEGMKGKIAELATKNEVLEMEKGEIEAEVCRILQEKEKVSQLVDEIGERGENEAELGRMEEEKMAVEVQKRRAEEFVKALEKGKTALEKEFYNYRKERRAAMEEKNELIEKITQEKMTLEAELRKAVEDSDHKTSKFVKRNEVLVRQKDELEAEIRKAKKHKINDFEEISQLKDALEDQKTQMEVAEKHISKILKTVGVLEREKEALDAKEREKSEEMNRILKEKMDLEAEKRAMEDEHKKKVLELFEMIEVLKREKMEREAKFCQANRENSEEIKRTLDSKMALEAENRRLKALEKELNLKVEGLEKEKGEIEAAKLCKAETEKSGEIMMMKRMEGELKALKDEKIQLVSNIDVLKKEKRDKEIEFRKAEKAKSAEIDMILNEKRTLQVLNEGMKGKIAELGTKNEVLELEEGEIEAEVCMILQEKQKISQLVDEIGVLEKERGEKEAELGRLEEEKMVVELQKSKAEEFVKALEKGKTALEKEFCNYKKERRAAMEEKNGLIEKITQEKMNLEAELRKAVEDSDHKISSLVKRNEVLVRQKDELEAEIRKAKKHKINDSEEISELKEALEDKKTQMEVSEKRVYKILKTVRVLERENEALDAKEREKSEEIHRILKEKMDLEAQKWAVEDKHKKKVLDLLDVIEMLKREKMKMEANFCQSNREISEEIKRVLKEKMDVEAEMRTLKEGQKKISELFHKIEVLEREKMEMKTEFCQANKEKDEEIKRILNENVAIKAEKTSLNEEGEKKISELAARIGILEREKRGLDEEIMQKDEVIQVIAQENDSLEDMKKKLRMEINGLASMVKKTVNLFQPVHHPRNVDMLRTPLPNEGKKSLGNFKRKRTNIDACKTKRHSSEDSSGDIGNSSSHVTEDLASCRRTRPTMWEADQDLLDALDGDPELCLEAICALYRQYKSSLSSKPTNSVLSLGLRGLKPDYSSKVIALAEYLIDEDPEGRMKKSVAELEQLDPAAVGECIAIAKHHYEQVFEIYKNKEGPFFLS